MLKFNFKKEETGAMLVMALVFTTLFSVMAMGLASVIASQHKLGIKKIYWNQAMAAAEAGINYYRWHLAHAPGDYQDGTGLPGPYVHDYKDNLGNTIGQFALSIVSPPACSDTVEIESTGWVNRDPKVTRTIKVKYGKPSLAAFAFLTNSNVWFGDTENLHGPVHSNGGIRMDGYNIGITTSAQETYLCTSSHGCSNQTKDGVWGAGGDKSLWDFPVSNIDFDAVTMDLSTLENLARNTMCSATEDCYFPQQGLGYHLVFLGDGTFNIFRVTKLVNPVWGYDTDGTWKNESHDFERESFIGNYNIPANCGIIFVSDDLWIEGVINGKVTVVAAKLPVAGNSPEIIINGNLIYTQKDGSDALGLISQSNIRIPLYSALDHLEINGALMAQQGSVSRKHYCRGSNCTRSVPNDARDYIVRDTLSLYGTIITNSIWTWSWVDSWGNTTSGYENTDTVYDPNLTYNPPPGFPTTGDYQILRWEEITEKK